ncbi:Putative DNA topoisomerase [Penicillium brasilianum]|uniref:DNA topoisomerase n=2 Tax=Penicillium brasilianum TaxID=104259 RepID=A0A0F7TKI7_PENBI|nr:Putative DNA topoisomerase [Penicillium brasilianum]
MTRKILCVAEKPAIARAVATHMSGGSFQTHAIRGNQYVKNYEFDFNFGAPWGNCSVTMTSVLGHLTGLEFDRQYKGWMSCPPGALFEAPVQEDVDKDKKPIAENIRNQARYSKALFIWTDCDREGEHIGAEVRNQAKAGNALIEVKRARFSNTERAHVLQAAREPIELDEFQANAVAARIELDLRIGAAFTRLQTLQLQAVSAVLKEKVISYGSCQFPTLGFVVDRYLRVQNFKPETFWSIKVMLQREGKKVNFLWKRVHLFDRAAVTMMLERCLKAKQAKVTKVSQKPKSKWRPLPLTTVDLQMMGSRFLRLDSQTIMKVAEALYTKGYISYPRTETDQFDKAIDLKKLVEKQFPDNQWGQYAKDLIEGKFRTPRSGRNNDKAHPPIHPVCWVSPNQLNANEKKVYEFVVRRFLACCSDDAKGQGTDIEIQYGEELFHTSGLVVLERNYLDVYVYDKWESSQQLPNFERGETFEPTEANISEGKTTAPNYLTEPELIGLMDANGIGTDATMAEHIAKIKEREYVVVHPRGSGRSKVEELIPTRLGVALVEGYDNVVAGLPNSISLSKPFLRKEMELRMLEICAGSKSRQEVVQQSLDMYREVFIHTQRRIEMLKAACRKYLNEQPAS